MLIKGREEGGACHSPVRREKKMRYARILIMFSATLLASGLPTLGQNMPNIQMPTSPSANITVSPFDAAQFPMFTDFFTGAKAALQPVSLVLTNNSDKAIAGIEVEWVTIGSDGRERHVSSQSDNFFSRGSRAVAAAHDRLLVSPYGFLSESTVNWIKSGAGHSGVIAGGGGADFDLASQVRISLDCVVFEDGEVVGPNQRRYTDEIQARRDAANEVVQVVQSALKQGLQPSTVLSPLVNVTTRRGDFVGTWKVRYAQQLLRTPYLDVVLASLENMPSPPKFYRTDGGQP
jgi:hypothetical protein